MKGATLGPPVVIHKNIKGVVGAKKEGYKLYIHSQEVKFAHIVGTVTVGDGGGRRKKYTGYVVEVKCNQSVWRVTRRYNDFFELDKVSFFFFFNMFSFLELPVC